MAIKVFIVDDHTLFRESLKALLEKDESLQIVGACGNGQTTLAELEKTPCDVVLMDITIPGLNGIDTTRAIREKFPGIKVLALTVHTDSQVISQMLQAGAVGYVLKDCALEELQQAIRSVMADAVYLCPQIAKVVVKSYTDFLSSNFQVRPSPLSARERAVLQLLAEGKGTKHIAAELHVSVKTVETHRKHIMDKLCLRTIAELTKYAVREHLTSLDR